MNHNNNKYVVILLSSVVTEGKQRKRILDQQHKILNTTTRSILVLLESSTSSTPEQRVVSEYSTCLLDLSEYQLLLAWTCYCMYSEYFLHSYSQYCTSFGARSTLLLLVIRNEQAERSPPAPNIMTTLAREYSSTCHRLLQH